jgi:glyoxylase-like metal-dependent hydrolase (beta-lactamase superfamily II)
MTMKVACFTFNAFSENTYVLSDDTGECVVIDPGMTDEDEDKILFDYLNTEGLHPVKLLNTHCHIDHILGNRSVCEKYGIGLYAHPLENSTIARAPVASLMWGIPYRETPNPHFAIDEGDIMEFGNTKLEVRYTPGHAPGHVVFVEHSTGSVLAGDVLFRGSVGRVDLPGCNAADLVESIRTKLYTLPEHYVVYPGHGPDTTIGIEKQYNAFVRENWSGL